MPPTTLQNILIGEELLTSVRLIKTGLREVNHLDGSSDFYHFPILILSSGIERFMKVVLCCYYLENNGEFPTKSTLLKKGKGHNLSWLLDQIIKNCFPIKYVGVIAAAKEDMEFLKNDSRLHKLINILSNFGIGARYYNLNVVLGCDEPGPSPEDEWNKLNMEILKDDPDWTIKIGDPSISAEIYDSINSELTINIEKLIRSLSRLFTIGKLGKFASSISPHTFDFLFLDNNQLGKTNYDKIHI